jgi:large subunit ribosomal protein L3
MVTGLLGRKVGMTRIFSEDGRWIPVTLVHAGPCVVVQRKNKERDRYDAVQLGFLDRKQGSGNKPETGHCRKAGTELKRHLREFALSPGSEVKTGDTVRVDIFKVGDHVDVAGTSKGKGFQGVQKRHGFRGGPGTHGSNFHRRPGSIGQSADPSKVVKGKRLPGHMGSERVTTQNLEVVTVDPEKNLLVVRGSVPGAAGCLVEVRKTVKGTE